MTSVPLAEYETQRFIKGVSALVNGSQGPIAREHGQALQPITFHPHHTHTSPNCYSNNGSRNLGSVQFQIR